MSEYRWTWGTPYKNGIWLTAGIDPKEQSYPEILVVRSPQSFKPGWVCFLGEIPEPLPPKKQMTSVLWVKIPDQMDFEKFTTEAVWAKQGETLLSTQENTWVPTNVMRSYER